MSNLIVFVFIGVSVLTLVVGTKIFVDHYMPWRMKRYVEILEELDK